MSEPEQLSMLTSFVEDFPARTCPLPESGRAWLESDQDFGSSSFAFSMNLGHSQYVSSLPHILKLYPM